MHSSRSPKIAAAVACVSPLCTHLTCTCTAAPHQVEWLKARLERVPVRFCFESSLELMECTQVGGFKMAPGGKSKGPPPAVKKVGWAAGWGWVGAKQAGLAGNGLEQVGLAGASQWCAGWCASSVAGQRLGQPAVVHPA